MVVAQFEQKIVMPTKVGIHCGAKKKYLDSRFRGNDKLNQHLLYRVDLKQS